ncbi:MAG: hypothetical protein A2639_01600 [Candidatus Staskawiczbacteria bacterium RIFCSPHIGHO2_01_FULL_34_27]|uniref:PDZ domain-containing protein n=1 Tax=Candidatus Staskawiczbacteria bacterium RIFCSPHIGHO2_01_FULL_34_27 TaxID=1802199 RepID=A0A1G2HKF8_9BACT|nr:MAG: hypothetical protein A2639_01600 [Candidatus Staskawiczbacteria bacterium RIFCSPHIGHO2_01_FULL_34_27]
MLITILLVVFVIGFVLGKNQAVCKVCKPESVDFSLFWDAYNKLRQNFISPEKIDNQKILYGAIAGMTKSLGDPYTDFFNPDQAKMFNQDLLGSFEGIGVEVGTKKEQLTVIAPLKGTPGDKAGLKAGDLIIKINSKNTSDMSEQEAVNNIRGKKGTEVILTIFRDGWNQTKEIKIIRDTIKVNSIDWELKDGDIAYISIHQFDQSLSADFKKISFQILDSPAKKIILDLRNNPGGYLEVSQDIASWFLKSGQVVTIEDFGKNKNSQQYKAQGNNIFVDYPMVILINKGSASAAEILAGALRDNRNIQLVGEKSFGKGSVQKLVELNDGESFIKITIAKWLTPKGSSISEVGLSPDVKIDITDNDLKVEKDSQLDKAIEIIKKLK